MYCYLEFKLHKNLKLFSIRVKELLQSVVLQKKKKKKKKSDGLLLFLKAVPSKTDLCVTLGDFTVKNAKLGRENSI